MLIKTYHLYTEAEPSQGSRLLLFKGTFPLRYRVVDAFFNRSQIGTDAGKFLYVRVRQFGAECVPVRFLVAFETLNDDLLDLAKEVEMPRVLLAPHDPPDSDEVQFSFWQGLRVGGSTTHDVFDVSHLKLEGFDDVASPAT